MSTTNSFVEMIVSQAHAVINTMKDLKRIAGKKGKERGALIERFTANSHSFNVHTYASQELQKISEVQLFKDNVILFSKEFDVGRFDFDGEVNVDRVEQIYDNILDSYNDMVIALGFEKEIVNVKRF